MDVNELLSAAKSGDQQAFSELTEPYRHELNVHCYRMLAAPQDAEDAVQTAYLRAWQNIDHYQLVSNGSLRSWLYKIATNICIDLIRGQPGRTLLTTNGQADILAEERWIQPMPSGWLSELNSDPEAIYLLGELVHLAFVTVIQRLSPRQRAVLLLRDVLGMRAGEAAQILDISEIAVNSALLRARKLIQDDQTMVRIRERPTMAVEQRLLGQYLDAWKAADIDRLISLIKDDSTLSMPPTPTWFQGAAAIRAFLSQIVFGGGMPGDWNAIQAQANGQAAMAIFHRSAEGQPWRFFGLEVFTFESDRIARMDLFLTGYLLSLPTVISASWVPYFDPLQVPSE